MEARLDKRVILERYLDLIELGEGVRGIGAAARHWFARPAERLSIRQAAFLAALTPAPRTLSRLVRGAGGRLPPEVAERVEIVLRAMRVAGVIDRATYARARKEPLHLAPTAVSRSP
jgi:penicillin-binding protein 1A